MKTLCKNSTDLVIPTWATGDELMNLESNPKKNSLFSSQDNLLRSAPLPEKLRPKTLDQVLGQEKAVSKLQQILRKKIFPSLLFYGPPGVGKTTLARLLAQESGCPFELLSATDAGVKELKSLQEKGREQRLLYQKKLLVFVDEIHRFNKTQQDALLPSVESGDIWLIGATTENPRISLNSALLSRMQVVELKTLSTSELEKILLNCLVANGVPSHSTLFTEEAWKHLVHFADGDARKALLCLEQLLTFWDEQNPLSLEQVEEELGPLMLRYDLRGDQHYGMISALIKSIRGSDPDAALYYLARMILGGEDPRFLCRRLIILASEDIGNADPRALPMAVACLHSVESVGLPEAELNLAQTVIFLSSAPKSNASYLAWKAAKQFAEQNGSMPPPPHLQSKSALYQYPHDHSRHFVKQNYWPIEIQSAPQFLHATEMGAEKIMKSYLHWLRTGEKPEEPARNAKVQGPTES